MRESRGSMYHKRTESRLNHIQQKDSRVKERKRRKGQRIESSREVQSLKTLPTREATMFHESNKGRSSYSLRGRR